MHEDPRNSPLGFDDFEAGFTPVVAILRSGELIARVGVRPDRDALPTDDEPPRPDRSVPYGVVRLERPGDRAFEFDAEGRLILAQLEGRGLRRTLDNRLLVTRHLNQGARRAWTREPSPENPLEPLARWHREAAEVRQEIDGGAHVVVLRGALDDSVRSTQTKLDGPGHSMPAALDVASRWTQAVLEAPARWNESALLADTERLREIYLPIPILPPDQYASIVLQATEGCSFNRCGFCNFYRKMDYRERSTGEFERHVDAVLAHLGRTARRYHRVFLGQANALLIDTELLLRHLEAVTQRLPLLPRLLAGDERRRWRQGHDLWIEGVYSFVDSFHRSKPVQELRALAEAGLRRVYLGLETGCPEVLRVLEKPGHPEAAVELARNLRQAGVHLGVIVLVGAGGRPHQESHLRETLRVLERMALQKGDQVYLSRLVIHEASEYAAAVRNRGLTPLSEAEQHRQQERFRREVLATMGVGVPVSPYDLSLSRRVFSV